MIALKFNYQGTVHVRRSTCGGMDSEYSHAEVRPQSYTVVVPEDTENYYAIALRHVLNYSGNIKDPAFRLTDSVEKFPVNAILHFMQRLD